MLVSHRGKYYIHTGLFWHQCGGETSTARLIPSSNITTGSTADQTTILQRLLGPLSAHISSYTDLEYIGVNISSTSHVCSTVSATIVTDHLQHLQFTYSGKETAFETSALDKLRLASRSRDEHTTHSSVWV